MHMSVGLDEGDTVMLPGAEFRRMIARERRLVRLLEKADRLYSARGLVANSIDCGKWINDVRDAISPSPASENSEGGK